jgi:hypothetical protein
MTGDSGGLLQDVSSGSGPVRVLEKPFSLEALRQVLLDVSPVRT